jgi:hypothetical protein
VKTQEIIQNLLRERLVTNAKMQAYDHNFDKLNMLITIAIDKVVTMDETILVAYELNTNSSLYVD